MDAKLIFTTDERRIARELVVWLREHLGDSLQTGDESALWRCFKEKMRRGELLRDVFGLNPVVSALQTARVAIEDTGLRRDGVIAIIFSRLQGHSDEAKAFGGSVATILHGLSRTHDLHGKSHVVESENFRNLLLSFAEDMRVILIMIAERVNLMRQIRNTSNTEAQRHVSEEATRKTRTKNATPARKRPFSTRHSPTNSVFTS